jgi:hypothetical protein
MGNVECLAWADLPGNRLLLSAAWDGTIAAHHSYSAEPAMRREQ